MGFGVPELITAITVLALIFVAWLIARTVRRRRATDTVRSPQPVETRPVIHEAPVRRSDHAQSRRELQIFLSYATADRSTAEELAMALSSRGWSIWWDRSIPPGKSFDQVIESALASARCVVVLWSRASVASDWVKAEASDAAQRRILVPAMIEEVTIPLEFRRIQAATLTNWRSSVPHPGFDSLVRAIETLTEAAAPIR
jgi:hypothetical protein